MPSTAVVWFRRDLRVHDQPALAEAVRDFDRVVPIFVLDPRLLHGRFASVNRTRYLLDCLEALDAQLRERGARLVVRVGDARTEVPRVAEETGATAVLACGDASPFARRRDAAVGERVDLRLRPGVYIGHLNTLRKKDGGPFVVYSPFWRVWDEQPRRALERAPSEIAMPRIAAGAIPSLEELGFKEDAPELADRPEPGEVAAKRAAARWIDTHLDGYKTGRNLLARPSSRMSQYLHFGCLSPPWLEERVHAHGGPSANAYRRELAWRDFYGYVLVHHPEIVHREFRPKMRNLRWSDDAEAFQAWCEGRTGFPVVDAGMRQLVACGWMHNRARMITASFLTKDLHLDWRLGERFFMEHLIDGDVGSNNGGWQWVAGTGTDPQDYTRVFNPHLQQEKFDPDGEYVRRWVPELGTDEYPEPIVDHAAERRRAIDEYRALT